MTTIVLLRHGRSTANAAGVLAGRTEGVGLDDTGRVQARQMVERLSSVTLDRLVSSPLQRCRETIAPLAEATGLPVEYDDRFLEVDYGQWSGRPLKDLGKEPLWRTVQTHPSAAVFPEGEGLAAVSARAVAGIRSLLVGAGEDDVILVCSHGDVIAAILADALGMHLDGYQRLVVMPASLSVVRYTAYRPFVERVNDSAELGTLRPPPAPAEADSPGAAGDVSGVGGVGGVGDAVVGGPAG